MFWFKITGFVATNTAADLLSSRQELCIFCCQKHDWNEFFPERYLFVLPSCTSAPVPSASLVQTKLLKFVRFCSWTQSRRGKGYKDFTKVTQVAGAAETGAFELSLMSRWAAGVWAAGAPANQESHTLRKHYRVHNHDKIILLWKPGSLLEGGKRWYCFTFSHSTQHCAPALLPSTIHYHSGQSHIRLFLPGQPVSMKLPFYL